MSFRFHQEIKDELQRLANADRRSLTNYIEIVLENHVREKALAKEAKSRMNKAYNK